MNLTQLDALERRLNDRVLIAHALVLDEKQRGSSIACANNQLPDGPVCPACGGARAPSGVDGGSWVHFDEKIERALTLDENRL